MSVVAVLALDGVLGFELTIPCLVFGTALAVAGDQRYEVRVCTLGAAADPVDAEAGGLAFRTPWGLDALERADTVFLPARAGFRHDPPSAALDAVRAAA
ncbi:AraC family transcriptional regulator, partial [Saccharothrix hoggarensis]